MCNKLKRPLQAVLLVALVGLCVWAIVPIQQKIHLGLDLQGGARVLLQLQTTADVKAITPEIQNQVEQVIDKRVNSLGVSAPVIPEVTSPSKNPRKFAALTRDHMGQMLTIFLDKQFVSAATIEGIISTDGMI